MVLLLLVRCSTQSFADNHLDVAAMCYHQGHCHKICGPTSLLATLACVCAVAVPLA